MRPINLIPPEDRRGEQAQLRTGPTAYVLLGVLALALLTVTALVLTGNGIDERNAELAALEAKEAAASQTAAALAPYVEFASMSAVRDETVTSLAQSRFDWERVLRELSLVIPEDVWLSTATGSVSPDATGGESAGGSSLRAGTSGPALELTGCAASQQAVAGLVASLEDIDGVTRVGISASERGAGAGGGETAAGGSSDCRTRNFIARFEIVAVFDAAPAAGQPAVAGAAPATAATDPETAGTVAAEQSAADSAATQTEKAGSAANVVTGGTP
jgi:Tfp pilus assembly protein PilN